MDLAKKLERLSAKGGKLWRRLKPRHEPGTEPPVKTSSSLEVQQQNLDGASSPLQPPGPSAVPSPLTAVGSQETMNPNPTPPSIYLWENPTFWTLGPHIINRIANLLDYPSVVCLKATCTGLRRIIQIVPRRPTSEESSVLQKTLFVAPFLTVQGLDRPSVVAPTEVTGNISVKHFAGEKIARNASGASPMLRQGKALAPATHHRESL
ncbi:hypothetical protein AAWM_00167 [Aspergillus awamori]|uniref:F-box domain-containing protein n=1 Tax=Aspergillus awamori TaxID=105351 RepID=A0A401KDG4_ASPAW|nr:hypothetical protein AAWM_00167 [Aspergillus awamori]